MIPKLCALKTKLGYLLQLNLTMYLSAILWAASIICLTDFSPTPPLTAFES